MLGLGLVLGLECEVFSKVIPNFVLRCSSSLKINFVSVCLKKKYIGIKIN